jgi:hypothetical protein
MRHIEKLRPEICSLDCGSMNFGPHVFINTPAHLADMAARAKASGTKPEIEVFEMGHIELGRKLVADGLIGAPPLFQICLGISFGRRPRRLRNTCRSVGVRHRPHARRRPGCSATSASARVSARPARLERRARRPCGRQLIGGDIASPRKHALRLRQA